MVGIATKVEVAGTGAGAGADAGGGLSNATFGGENFFH